MDSTNSYNFLKDFSDENGVFLEKACSVENIKELQSALPDKIESEFTKHYCSFLAISNGAQIENAVLYSSNEILNKLEGKFLIEFGYAGNIDAFIYDANTKKYNVTNFFRHNEIFQSFKSLLAMLNYILENQGVK